MFLALNMLNYDILKPTNVLQEDWPAYLKKVRIGTHLDLVNFMDPDTIGVNLPIHQWRDIVVTYIKLLTPDKPTVSVSGDEAWLEVYGHGIHYTISITDTYVSPEFGLGVGASIHGLSEVTTSLEPHMVISFSHCEDRDESYVCPLEDRDGQIKAALVGAGLYEKFVRLTTPQTRVGWSTLAQD